MKFKTDIRLLSSQDLWRRDSNASRQPADIGHQAPCWSGGDLAVELTDLND